MQLIQDADYELDKFNEDVDTIMNAVVKELNEDTDEIELNDIAARVVKEALKDAEADVVVVVVGASWNSGLVFGWPLGQWIQVDRAALPQVEEVLLFHFDGIGVCWCIRSGGTGCPQF